MEYIMINMLTILLFTYIVYKLVNKILAVQIHIKYLILCGSCAFLINSIFPRIFVGSAGLTGTLGIITIFAILSSYFIACYYDNTMKKAALENALTTTSIEVPETLQTDNNARIELDCLTDFVAKEYFYPVKYKEHNQYVALLKTNNMTQLTNSENILENTEAFTESVSKRYFYPVLLKNNNTNQQKKPEVLLINTMGLDGNAEVFNNLMNFKRQKSILMASLFLGKSIDENVTDFESEGLNSGDLLLENVNSKAMDEDCFSSLSDLDSLMDFAFSQKEQRNFLHALKAFHQALRLYPDSEVAPFLVMEIGTILKNLGSYNEAIKIFIEGRALVGVINNSILEQEFINNIAYLRVVKNILIQNSLKFMPFNLIPDNAIKEINKEFSEWRNQS